MNMQLKLDALQPTVVVVLFVVVGVAVERAPPTQRAVGMGQRGPRPGLHGERGVGHVGGGEEQKSKNNMAIRNSCICGCEGSADRPRMLVCK